ncbi:hypothetical protein CN895_07700 [Bacillus cereus]|uniref:hypothetical protein n=1 Tax=Bacillus cereus TaxID=1396 RepID=UPI000BFE9CAA|nr:hypothetical protein [Bacillus cereus]PGK15225.1 hypothetical protein CN895_07700 [Bacillus cereus]
MKNTVNGLEDYQKALLNLSIDELINLSTKYSHNMCVFIRDIFSNGAHMKNRTHYFHEHGVHLENFPEFITEVMDQLHNIPTYTAHKMKTELVFELSRIAVFLEEDKYNISNHVFIIPIAKKLKGIIEK